MPGSWQPAALDLGWPRHHLTKQLPTLQLPPDAPGQLLRELRDILEPGGLRVFGGLPRDGVLQGVRLDAIAAALGTRFIAGQRDLLDASAAEVESLPMQSAAVTEQTACFAPGQAPRRKAAPDCDASSLTTVLKSLVWCQACGGRVWTGRGWGGQLHRHAP